MRITKHPALGYVVEIFKEGGPDSVKTGIVLSSQFGKPDGPFLCSFAGTTWDTPVCETWELHTTRARLEEAVIATLEAMFPEHSARFARKIDRQSSKHD